MIRLNSNFFQCRNCNYEFFSIQNINEQKSEILNHINNIQNVDILTKKRYSVDPHKFGGTLTQQHNLNLLEQTMRESYQKVLSTKPPTEFYVSLEAFALPPLA
jgi:hypothetical protein